jgi:hypothetical protein
MKGKDRESKKKRVRMKVFYGAWKSFLLTMLQGVALTERDKWNKLLAFFSWMIAMPIDARFNEIWFNEIWNYWRFLLLFFSKKIRWWEIN